jgi:hypothetical protein
MAAGDIHTVFEDGVWKNKIEGGDRASNVGGTKADRESVGRDMAVGRGVEHFIHRQDGTIGERNTYPRSRDPRSSNG